MAWSVAIGSRAGVCCNWVDADSLPPCGGELGWGVGESSIDRPTPSPAPPHKGEGSRFHLNTAGFRSRPARSDAMPAHIPPKARRGSSVG